MNVVVSIRRLGSVAADTVAVKASMEAQPCPNAVFSIVVNVVSVHCHVVLPVNGDTRTSVVIDVGS